jgi:alpha-galactosidase
MREKIVLIGAGSAMFTRGLLADMIRQKWEGSIALVDTSPEALAVAEGLARKMIEASGSGLTLCATTDRREALPGATAIICTIGVGGRRAWEQDVLVPRRHGIYQPVGDSVMPGGTSRALRMIPQAVAIARDVMDLAPNALFFNYANPMSAICRAVRKATGAPIIGLCHGVYKVARRLERLLGLEAGGLSYAAAGINHLTWFTRLSSGGRDLLPRLRAIAAERLSTLGSVRVLGDRFTEGGTAARGDVVVDDLQPLCWELFETFGVYPAPGDRHVAEFFGTLFSGEGAYYGRTLGVDSYSFEATIASGDGIFEQMRETARSKSPLGADWFARISGEHEQVTEIIARIRRDEPAVYSANLPNRGQVPNLPEGAVVECPALTAGGTLTPVVQPPLPAGAAGLLATRFGWVETVVEAALEGSREKFVQALLLDGAVGSVRTAGRLAEELIAAQAEYLPLFAREEGENGPEDGAAAAPGHAATEGA